MPTTTIDTTAPATQISHWVENRRGKKQNEELFFRFETTWRGEPAFVTMSVDKYAYASGEWSDWRIYCSEARKPEWGQHHSDTARNRLGEAFKPVVEAWLASDDYKASRAAAFARLARRVLEEMDNERDIPRVYDFIRENRAEFSDEFVQAVDEACVAFDSYRKQVSKVEQLSK